MLKIYRYKSKHVHKKKIKNKNKFAFWTDIDLTTNALHSIRSLIGEWLLTDPVTPNPHVTYIQLTHSLLHQIYNTNYTILIQQKLRRKSDEFLPFF